ncbi:hypothetical protein [Salipaludibacillus sp. CF4.18]|uniref:hypothetical protein n=1 Tax=Salipaludibacillus sp. CF4.18 TaxID=3373081 RepID=UPI003EE67D3B
MSCLIVIVVACSHAEATFSQAKKELPFPVLIPESDLDGWDMEETIYEDELLVSSFIGENNRQIDLIQDQNIQGLDIPSLREHLDLNMDFSGVRKPDTEVVEVSDYIGELSYFADPLPSIQYTFVDKKGLFEETNEKVPSYQVIGKEVSTEELILFVESLEASS